MAAAAALSDAAFATACARESLHVLRAAQVAATAVEAPGEPSYMFVMPPVASVLGRNTGIFDTYMMMLGLGFNYSCSGMNLNVHAPNPCISDFLF